VNVGIIGFGTIGRDIAKMILQGQAGNVNLRAVLVRTPPSGHGLPDHIRILTDESLFLREPMDLVIEAAGHEAVHAYARNTLLSGKHLIVVSVGAFSNDVLYHDVLQAAVTSGRKVIIPSCAIAGLDRVAAAALGPLHEVKLVTRKPPRAWRGTIAEENVDLDAVREPVCIYTGTARESARLFPESVNVAAALSLAGIGFDQTKVEVFVDPTIARNTHQIQVTGHFGSLVVEVQNTPSANNPKTGYIVAMSVVKTLRNLTTPLVIGI
jgi:aspartate dehydrogenase